MALLSEIRVNLPSVRRHQLKLKCIHITVVVEGKYVLTKFDLTRERQVLKGHYLTRHITDLFTTLAQLECCQPFH